VIPVKFPKEVPVQHPPRDDYIFEELGPDLQAELLDLCDQVHKKLEKEVTHVLMIPLVILKGPHNISQLQDRSPRSILGEALLLERHFRVSSKSPFVSQFLGLCELTSSLRHPRILEEPSTYGHSPAFAPLLSRYSS